MSFLPCLRTNMRVIASCAELLSVYAYGSISFIACVCTFTDISNATSQCTNGFISMDNILTPPDDLRFRDRAQRIIPSLNFSCDGAISKWIIRAQWNGGGTAFPDLQLWRSSSGNGVYTKVGNTTLYASESNSSSLYQMVVKPSLPFQRGDTLGIFQPSGNRSRLRIHYINGSGNPLNFVFKPNDSITKAPLETFTTTSSGNTRQTVLPFVTVEISKLCVIRIVANCNSSHTDVRLLIYKAAYCGK